MRCVICDVEIENIQDDLRQPGKLLPCAACLEAVNDIVYDDEPPEDDLDDIVYEDIELEDTKDEEDV